MKNELLYESYYNHSGILNILTFSKNKEKQTNKEKITWMLNADYWCVKSLFIFFYLVSFIFSEKCIACQAKVYSLSGQREHLAPGVLTVWYKKKKEKKKGSVTFPMKT